MNHKPAAIPPSPSDPRPLIVHVIYRLQMGGLENGVVNLINHLPQDKYRHAIVCLSDYTDFRERIKDPQVPVIAMNKNPGQDINMHKQLYRLFRDWQPAIVHTRNIGCLEAQVPALLARVPGRVHGEHGWDIHDKDGSNKKYQWLRRLQAPMVHTFIPLSGHLDDYLQQTVGIPSRKIQRIYNGVDTDRFQPGASNVLPSGFAEEDSLIFGTIGRMHGVKDQLNLVKAYIQLHEMRPQQAPKLRLILVGDGPLHAECKQALESAQLSHTAWMPGARNDVPDLLRALDVYVLPSQAEGISNTILEAMASGLPVVATKVGGNPELVNAEQTGLLPAAQDPQALANALARYVDEPALISQHGDAGLQRIRDHFSLSAMLDNYSAVYDALLAKR